jgi:hypothetical protein
LHTVWTGRNFHSTLSVTPCIWKPGLFDRKSADLESKVCRLSFFALCILEVWIP